MKLLIVVPLSIAAAFGARTFLCGDCCGARPAPLTGDYIEARTASVFAGACHYNGEYVGAGREAVLAWRFDGGVQELEGRDVSLAGVELAALVVGDDNLAEARATKRSVVYVGRDASSQQRDAAVAWLRANHADALGEIAAVESAEVAVEREGDSYRVRAGDALALDGELMPDRACCAMPFNVWYEPFEPLAERVVGCSESFSAREPRLGARFERHGANDAFAGRFGARNEPQLELRTASL